MKGQSRPSVRKLSIREKKEIKCSNGIFSLDKKFGCKIEKKKGATGLGAKIMMAKFKKILKRKKYFTENKKEKYFTKEKKRRLGWFGAKMMTAIFYSELPGATCFSCFIEIPPTLLNFLSSSSLFTLNTNLNTFIEIPITLLNFSSSSSSFINTALLS